MEHTRKSQVVQNAQLKIFTHLLICCTQPISLVNSNYFVSLSWIKSPFLTVDTSSSSQDDEFFTLKIKTNATDLRFHSKPKFSSCIFPDFPRTEGFFFFLLFGIFPSFLIRAREWKTDFPTRIFHGQLHENAKWTPIKRRSILENINSFSVVGARWISTNFYSFSLFSRSIFFFFRWAVSSHTLFYPMDFIHFYRDISPKNSRNSRCTLQSRSFDAMCSEKRRGNFMIFQ